MSSNDTKLNTNEKVHLGIEACLQLIPNIGGALATSFYGYQKEKKLKRLESFYNELSADIEVIKASVQSPSTTPDSEELLSIIENLNEKVEREHIEEKRNYFKTYFINNMLHHDQINYDNKKFFLDTLANMTLIECNIILDLFERPEPVSINAVSSGAMSKFQMIGAMHRLQSYGFIEMKERPSNTVRGELTKDVSITHYGIRFVMFCLKQN
ncbi:hypothetical protein COA05_01535 [Bacillus thuringiensis]|uniref:hypothetical protein n=1 Tax=Bacillus thuringiensis TaxID=1428 RepID=UPI000676E63C|nr:hypothetical protein [Bacillus thuringiensis]MEB8877609.1 hypothetical protein [Bacillus cereus]AKR36863.1 Hypothetical protein NF53_3785 [Bacillus thuringiensis serovar indiana]MBG9646213.1 hypothetical protein [Bacillus thuringiensis]MBG9652862.1 hypothetical protein [Bacillus thuringiensis]MEB9615501.1 hypothetical protein [Bacillus cereus]